MREGINSSIGLRWAVGLGYSLMLVLLPFSNVSLRIDSMGLIIWLIVAIGAFWAFSRWRGLSTLAPISECLGVLFLLTIPAVVATYMAIGVGKPLADETLAAIDAALGFHWPSFVKAVDSWPLLAWLLGNAYTSFPFQLLVLPVLLCLGGRVSRARAFVTSYAALCGLASLVSIWWPAVGAYIYFEMPFDAVTSIDTHFAYFFLPEFHAVRAPERFMLELDRAAGILTFPSVHAGVAALCVWGAWSMPQLRYPILVLNVAMALSAVTHGSHYFVDVVAGIGCAALCVAAVRPFFPEGGSAARATSTAGEPLGLAPRPAPR